MHLQFQRYTVILFALFVFAGAVFAQNGSMPKPRKESLLNGLEILIWSRSEAKNVTIKLRIHTGSAYDPQNKEGTLALLGDILFPNESVKQFFEDDLDGDLEVTTTYDYIQVTASARSDAFLAMLETVAPAVTNPLIDKENTAAVIAKRLELLSDLESDPDYLARSAAAERLFGEFPYGRPVEGTRDSLENIDFAELIFAKERYFTADNATLTIEGSVRSDFAYLAVRRLFGGWGKRGKIIPATFRLPAPPKTDPYLSYLNAPEEVRNYFAVEGAPRPGIGYYPLEALRLIVDKRLHDLFGSDQNLVANAVNRSYFLKGIFLIGRKSGKMPDSSAVGSVEANAEAREMFLKALEAKISLEEFSAARSKLIGAVNVSGISDLWLDVKTYNLKSPQDEVKKAGDLALKDVQKAADEIRSRTGVEVILIARPLQELETLSDPKDPHR